MSNPTLETNVTIDGFSRIDFDRRKVRKSMGVIGRDVQKEARRLIARRAISGADEYPGRRTGRLWRAVKYHVSRSGFMVKIQPDKTGEMKDYYPAYLYYGVRKMRSLALAKRHKKQPEGPYRLAPRANFMTDALDNRSQNTRSVLRNTLQDALIPRK